MEPVPGRGWDKLAEELVSIRGTAMIIGGVDAGKSTLVRYLAGRLLCRVGKVSVVDADIGQSSLGLPGTISMKVFRGPKALRKFSFQKMLFVGATNPAQDIENLVAGTKRLAEVCRKSADIVLVDTTGLVTGAVGRALKVNKTRAIKPEHVIALQRKDELEHILAELPGIRIHRLAISEFARSRSRAERAGYRRRRFDAYFGQLSLFRLRRDETAFLRSGKSFSPEEEGVTAGSLIGLNKGRYTAALGIVEKVSRNAVDVLSPVRSLQKVDRVLFGDIIYHTGRRRATPSGKKKDATNSYPKDFLG